MLTVEKLEVLNDNVFVEGIKEEKRGGVVVGISQDDKPQLGLVLKVGPGRFAEDGILIGTILKPGMIILFNEHATTKFLIDTKTYYVLKEEDVVAYQTHGKKMDSKSHR